MAPPWSEAHAEQLICRIQQGLLAEGIEVSVAKLCAWFGIPRRTVYYKPVQAAPKVDPRFSEPIKKMIEVEPSFGYRTVAWLLGFNKNTVQRVRHLSRTDGVRCLTPDQGLAGAQTPGRHTPPHPGRPVGCSRAERTLVDRSRPHLDRQGRLGLAGVRPGNDPPDRFLTLLTDRLPHARTAELAPFQVRQGDDRQRRP
ncbi:hypothetical protein [Arenibacterium sp. LLYu02]|uniref:hypothetical protein n=1 Tax=Arenibacterium sp. LLYu02 TaxID=3404132 RepID=UPI003B226212